MKKYNPENERIKHWYIGYLREAKRQSEASLDAVAKALSRFETFTTYRGFKDFHINQAVAFKRSLAADQVNRRTGEPLSKATLYATLNAVRNFFHWLAGQPGFKSRLSYSDADYFNLSEKETRIATAHRERPVPTLEQIKCVLRTMPANSEIERRDRALVAFTILTGMRDRAIASLKLKHIDLREGLVEQDSRDVMTKASKTFTTWFFPVGDEPHRLVVDWVEYLRKEKLWGLNDPLFPRTKVEQNANREFAVAGLEREHWSSAAPIRAIFAAAFVSAGLPYYHPHSFRKTLVRLGENICRTPEEFKAWSQNLGHEHVLTTFTSYGGVSRHRQAEIMRDLRNPQKSTEAEDRLRKITEDVYRAQGRAT
jgi:integrase/recombinase XerD